ncbi:MAG: FprA family A-type flavoprotein [Bacteroidales bacterium]|nr:FprA family A-type flavoprotein [Bacteroidales bacterium]MCB9000243.1 FprA family A-type flavoprotein [Bacteroidales bacterium]MCB9013362.1 FprA family A-type flavoprotein [Bacteroidales bacterium]
MKDSKVLKINPDVSWVGVLDYDIVTFDVVMETKYGTTYNSYFINAEKKTIIDTVKLQFWDTYLEKLKTITDPTKIDYIICNHTEPDHSGCISNLLELSPDLTVIGSGQALNYLQEMIGKTFKSKKVKDGDIIDLGNKKIRVIGAPNLHWPDTIYTYLEEDKILFTCDSFGAHYCHEEMYDDKTPNYDEAFAYYFEVILRPFSKFMLKAIEKIRPLEISAVCPGHGPILRSDWKKYIDISEQKATEYLKILENKNNRVLLAYVSAYGYTAEMAKQIAAGIAEAGSFEIDLVDIENILLGELEEKIVMSNAILIGSPTINQNTLLPVYKLFSLINPIRDKGKPAAVFGSYGWSGEAVKLIEDHLRNLKLKIYMEGMAEKFYPYDGKSERLAEFGKAFGEKMLEEVAENE